MQRAELGEGDELDDAKYDRMANRQCLAHLGQVMSRVRIGRSATYAHKILTSAHSHVILYFATVQNDQLKG